MKKLAAAGWRRLFDGATLQGWEPHQAATWGVAGGAIFCEADSPGWLGTVDRFADFNLKVEFRGPAQVNSGIFLRSQKEGAPAATRSTLRVCLAFSTTFRPAKSSSATSRSGRSSTDFPAGEGAGSPG